MHKNILITGANGQVGQAFQSLLGNHNKLSDEYRFHFTSSDILDITNEKDFEHFILDNKIDIIVNSAAYTAVDDAEKNKETAYKVNENAVRNMAKISKKYNVQLIHISTDYVFDGTSFTPIVESETTNPQGIYGKSKCAGEEAILDINPKNAIIIRTSWVYSTTGNNFVKTMIRIGKEKDAINVVYDQIGTPTYAADLANAILSIVHSQKTHENVVIYHYSNEGVCSWYDFAEAIFEIAHVNCQITPISTDEYPTPARRPSYSVLNKTKIKKEYNIKIPYWKNSLKSCIKQLIS